MYLFKNIIKKYLNDIQNKRINKVISLLQNQLINKWIYWIRTKKNKKGNNIHFYNLHLKIILK